MRIPEIVGYVHSNEEIHVQFRPTSDGEPLELVNFGYHKTRPSYTYGPLMRDFTLIHLVLSGHGCVVIDRVRYDISPGQCFLFRPNQIHYYESDGEKPWEYYYIGFGGEKAGELLSEAGFSQGVIAKSLTYQKEVMALFKLLCQTVSEPIQPLLQRGYLYQILHYLVRGAEYDGIDSVMEQGRAAHDSPNYVRIATGILHHNFHQSITVEMIAEQLGLSSGYLNTLFRLETGRSIYQYLLEYRIKKACELLTTTTKPIKRIALEVGYFDSLYFSRIFRKHTGFTPTHYRHRAEEEKSV